MPRTYTKGPYRKSHLVRHGNAWKYRRGVPHDLRGIIGKTAWVQYLGDVERSVAEIAAHTEDAKNGDLIKRLRALTPNERAEIAGNGGLEAFKLYAKAAEIGIPFVQIVADMELPTDDTEDDPEGNLAQSALMIMQARQSVTRLRAEAQKARKAAAKLDGRGDGAELLSLVDLWHKVKRPRSDKAIEKTQLYVRRFVDVVGNLEPKKVTRDHVIRYRDGLEKRGLTSSNITQHLDKIHTLFNVALSEGKVDANPAYKIKARKDGGKLSDGRQGFTSTHVRNMILVKLKGEREDFGWIVRLLAYHGARSGEICQLRCDDVTTLHGVHVFRVHDRHGRVKNKASIRDVPIHPKCNKIVAYAKRVAAKHGADAWLFPDLPSQTQGRAHWFQNYASREFLRQTCGIKESWYTMHSLRHTWRTLAREIDMPEAVSRSLMGHSLGKDDHAGYGGVPSLRVRAEWMAKIDPVA